MRKFSRNPICADLTAYSKKLATVEMVDKMHMKGHTDPQWKQHCDAINFTDPKKVIGVLIPDLPFLELGMARIYFISCAWH